MCLESYSFSPVSQEFSSAACCVDNAIVSAEVLLLSLSQTIAAWFKGYLLGHYWVQPLGWSHCIVLESELSLERNCCGCLVRTRKPTLFLVNHCWCNFVSSKLHCWQTEEDITSESFVRPFHVWFAGKLAPCARLYSSLTEPHNC